MPAIDLFRRRTMLGGDDLQPAGLLTIVGRIVQVMFLCGPIIRHTIHEGCAGRSLFGDSDFSDGSCRHSHLHCRLLVAWISFTVLYCGVTGVWEWRIVYWSSQGSPTQTEPRNAKVRHLLEMKLAAFPVLLFFIWSTGVSALGFALPNHRCLGNGEFYAIGNSDIGTVVAGRLLLSSVNSSVVANSNTYLPFFYQHNNWWWLAAVVLLVAQGVEVFMSWMFLWQIFAQPIGIESSFDEQQPPYMYDEPALTYNHELMEEMWAERCAASCRCLSSATCYMFGGRSVASMGPSGFSDVARALADFLESRGVLDVVPSDIVAGLVVLQCLQRQRVYAARLQYLDDMRTIGSAESGIVIEDSDDESATAAAATATSKKYLVAKSNIRKRIATSSALTTISSSSIPTTSTTENLLMPFEAEAEPVAVDSSHRRIYNSEDCQPFFRFDEFGRFHQEHRALLSAADVSEVSLLQEAARYAKYALAIYTWVLYLYEHPFLGPVQLMTHNSCGCCCRAVNREDHQPSSLASPVSSTPLQGNHNIVHGAVNDHLRIEGDSICEAHKRAILLTAGIDEADLIYVQLRSSFSDVPYCILIDHRWKSIVVSIRGTFSLEDCVTDVLIEPESLEQLGNIFGFDGSNQYCHGGVLASARNIHRDLDRHGLLDQLLLGDNAQFATYSLRFCGHSLGAATATLVSYMLRQKFPSLRCLNYSPPGCTFTWEMSTGCKEWCTSCVLDSDLVPRLSVNAMERLRDEVLELIGRIKVPKIEVARRFVHSTLWGIRLFNDTEQEDKEVFMKSIETILYKPDEVPDSEFQRQLTRFKAIQEERRRERGTTRSIQLYPPGRILHLAKTGEARSLVSGLAKCITCCTTNMGSRYVPVWINTDDLNEIVVSPTLGTDHFPNRIRSILEETAEHFCFVA